MLAGRRQREALPVTIARRASDLSDAGRDGPRTYILPELVQVTTTTQPGTDTDADTVVVGAFEGEDPSGTTPAEVGELLSSGEARRSLKALGLTHAQGKRWLLVGLGDRADLTAERARVVAAAVHARALEIGTRALCAQLGSGVGGEIAAAFVEGTILADYRFELYKSAASGDAGARGGGAQNSGTQGGGTQGGGEAPAKHLQRLIVSAPDGPGGESGEDELGTRVARAVLVAEAANSARELQNRPANDLTPTALAKYAVGLAEEIEALSVEVEGRAGIQARGMGAFAAVAQGSEQEPALITLRYEPPGEAAGAGVAGPLLGFVGKAVTFDSGGISLKPGAKMAEMKFDMSGGAAVIEAVAAIARLGLGVRLVAVVGATENLPSGRSVKPGDIVTAANGTTIEVNNTDAEGRMVLADCLCHAVALGAERIVDLATLTGAVIVALGSTYSGLMSNDDELAERVIEAGAHTGEIAWRLPLHEEYDELIKGTYGDLDNAPEARKAGTIVGAAFLSNFVGQVPWAHLDIAGSAWDLGREYVGKGASGYGVRLLVELARSYCA
ncbi:MAG TPA: leucyl aminopeptidase [Solirubrobacteraceae bacterium]|nr:leucyl aminopeptidase [Solirubrobacteraceae bacterium]